MFLHHEHTLDLVMEHTNVTCNKGLCSNLNFFLTKVLDLTFNPRPLRLGDADFAYFRWKSRLVSTYPDVLDASMLLDVVLGVCESFDSCGILLTNQAIAVQRQILHDNLSIVFWTLTDTGFVNEPALSAELTDAPCKDEHHPVWSNSFLFPYRFKVWNLSFLARELECFLELVCVVHEMLLAIIESCNYQESSSYSLNTRTDIFKLHQRM